MTVTGYFFTDNLITYFVTLDFVGSQKKPKKLRLPTNEPQITEFQRKRECLYLATEYKQRTCIFQWPESTTLKQSGRPLANFRIKLL